MMGTKERNFLPLPNDISLEDLVPEDNFYRRLQEKLDLSFVRELVEDRYAHFGRPSVDPEVFFRLQLVMFHEGIRSERELMRIVSDRLSVRWYVDTISMSHCPITPASPASAIASGCRCSASSSSGSWRSALRRVWCGAKSCTSMPPRWTPTPPWTPSLRGSTWKSTWANSLPTRKSWLARNKMRSLPQPTASMDHRHPNSTSYLPPTIRHSLWKTLQKTTGSPETAARDANKEACGTGARRISWPRKPIPTPLR